MKGYNKISVGTLKKGSKFRLNGTQGEFEIIRNCAKSTGYVYFRDISGVGGVGRLYAPLSAVYVENE